MLLKQGSAGQEVVELQQALGINADGIFGAGTKAAVETSRKKMACSSMASWGHKPCLPSKWYMPRQITLKRSIRHTRIYR